MPVDVPPPPDFAIDVRRLPLEAGRHARRRCPEKGTPVQLLRSVFAAETAAAVPRGTIET
jgi:hypothetical protein